MNSLLKLSVFILLFFLAATSSLSADTPAPLPVNPGVTGGGPSSGIQTGADQDVMTDIIDIKDNVAIGFDFRIVYIFIGIIAVLFLIALFIYLIDRYIKKKRKDDMLEELVVPAEVIAMHDLEALEKIGFDDSRIFYFTLTAILKTYLEGRFGIGAPEMTTEELLPKINNIPMDKFQANDVKDLLKRSDPVKFAGLDEKREQMMSDIDFVKTFVNRTTPDDQDMENESHE